MNTTHTVYTQTLENYGSHDKDGRYKNGNAYWKFKGGSTYTVEGVDRVEDAVAFIASIITHNNIHFKEYVAGYVEGKEFENEENIRINVNDYMNANKEKRVLMLSGINTDEQLTLIGDELY